MRCAPWHIEAMCNVGRGELKVEANSAASKCAGPAESGVGMNEALTANTKASVCLLEHRILFLTS
jgi:hypothetical protein